MKEKLRLVVSLTVMILIVVPIHIYRPERSGLHYIESQVLGSTSFETNAPTEVYRVKDVVERVAAGRGFPNAVDGLQPGYRKSLETYGYIATELRGTGYKYLYIDRDGESACVEVRLFASQFETSDYAGLFYEINKGVKKALGNDVKVFPNSGCGGFRDEVL